MVVDGNHVEGYLDDTKYLDYTYQSPLALYESANVDDNGDIIIKLVNPTDHGISVNTRLEDFTPDKYNRTAQVTVLSGDSLTAVNSFNEPEKIIPSVSEINIDASFTYEAPGYSVSILRISISKE